MEAAVEEAIVFLNKAKTDVSDLEQTRSEAQTLNSDRIRIQKQLSQEEKAVNDAVSATVKKRRDEISTSYDSEIGKAQDKLRKHKNKKEKAKTEGKKERIEYETTELREESRQLKNEFASILKKNRVPGMCKHRWFYTFFMPVGFGEHLLVALVDILLVILLPFAICMIMGVENNLILTSLHAVFFIAVMGPCAYIYQKVVYKHYEVLKRAATLLRHQERNAADIKKIARAINSDEGEEYYDLEDFNYDIAKAEAMVEEISKKKDDALEQFDTVTARVIEDEIREGSRKKISDLKRELAKVSSECAEMDEVIREMTVKLTDRYAGMIGKENLSVDSINGVIKVLKNGEAVTITEAVSIYTTNKL
ncbi:MAG: hypothetical protein K6F92_10180 [Lachnospiraceae bacterium]|nr:hypothetical protein [Lachnospiraceae bacterium]